MDDGRVILVLLVSAVVLYFVIYLAVVNAIKASREPEDEPRRKGSA